ELVLASLPPVCAYRMLAVGMDSDGAVSSMCGSDAAVDISSWSSVAAELTRLADCARVVLSLLLLLMLLLNSPLLICVSCFACRCSLDPLDVGLWLLLLLMFLLLLLMLSTSAKSSS